MSFLAGPRGLKKGEDITFFYPSSEWNMAQVCYPRMPLSPTNSFPSHSIASVVPQTAADASPVLDRWTRSLGACG